MRFLSLLSGSVAMLGAIGAAQAQPFKIVDVASLAALPISQLAPQTIAFADHKGDNLVDKSSGLMRFDDWAQTRMVQKQFLGLFPSYDEPTINAGGNAKPHKKRLHMYVAEARFVLKRARRRSSWRATRRFRSPSGSIRPSSTRRSRRTTWCRTRIRKAPTAIRRAAGAKAPASPSASSRPTGSRADCRSASRW